MHKLQEFRLLADLSQADVAAAVGVSQAAISQAEAGSLPRLPVMRAIVKALNDAGVSCTLDDVFPPESESGRAA